MNLVMLVIFQLLLRQFLGWTCFGTTCNYCFVKFFYSPMEEQRERYGPPLYSLTKMVLSIRLFLSLSWRRYEAVKL